MPLQPATCAATAVAAAAAVTAAQQCRCQWSYVQPPHGHRQQARWPSTAPAAPHQPTGSAMCAIWQPRRHLLTPSCTAAGPGAASGPAGLPPYATWPSTAKVALRTGVYITLLGLGIFGMPAAVFGAVFDASRVASGWVRVGGVLASLFGFYYVGAALDDAEGRHPRHFYASTVLGRMLLSAAFTGMVATGQCEPGLLWLAAANAASSLLLWQALRQQQRERQA